MRRLNWALLSFMLAPLAIGAAYAKPLPKAEYACNFGNPDPQDRSGDSVVYRCRPAGDNAPVFNVAVLKGASEEVNRAHGYLLAREAELGPLSEVVDLVQYGITQHSFILRGSLENVVTCFSDNLFNSTTPEFRASVAAFEKGYREQLGKAAKYKTPQLRLASTSIELDNIMTAVGYQHGKVGGVLAAEKACPGSLLIKAIVNGGLKLVGRDKGLGCTAFAIPAKNRNGTVLSADGLLVGRTLDAELMRSWNRVPTLFVIHEQGKDDQGRPYLSYVATGSAGLLYPGGISGYNTEGITATLHQMYASEAVHKVPADEPRKAALAPIIQQTILREARSIDDAVRIANRYQAIATWTILIAEAKTGKAAAIEITTAGAKLVRETQAEPIAQTNHLFDKEQQRFAFFPNYNKYEETHVRMATLEKAFDRLESRAVRGHPFDATDAIAQLANHDDVGGRFQPFGTTAVKSYDVMSTVMAPEAHRIYMSVGDFAPSPHATFLGFQLDDDLNPVAALGSLRDQSLAGTPGVLQSLSDYVQARLAYETGDPAGAERLLRLAIQHASDEASNGGDPAFAERRAGALRIYNYILARLLAIKGTEKAYGPDKSQAARSAAYREALQLFDAIIGDQRTAPLQRALAEYHEGLAEAKFRRGALGTAGLSSETRDRVNHALEAFQSAYRHLEPGVEIKDIDADIENAQNVLTGAADKVKAGDIDWVVIK